MKLRTAIAAATSRLSDAGVDSPEHDARALAVHVLGLAKPSDLLMVDDLDGDRAVAYDALVACGSVAAARDKGLYRMEGKEYPVKDGDVLLFKFNV